MAVVKTVYLQRDAVGGGQFTYAGVNCGRWVRARVTLERHGGLGLRIWGRGYRLALGLYSWRKWGLVRIGRRRWKFGTTRDF